MNFFEFMSPLNYNAVNCIVVFGLGLALSVFLCMVERSALWSLGLRVGVSW